MGAILNNEDAEALILDIRIGRHAEAVTLDGGSGSFILFPTVVIIDRPGRGQLVFPLHTSVEPGALCRHAGAAAVSAVVDGVAVEGQFRWTVTDGPGEVGVTPSTYHFLVDGRSVPTPSWACQLPRSTALRRRNGAQLLRDRERLVRQGHLAEHWLMVLSQRVMEASCRGPLRRVLATHRLVQEEDVVQRGLQVAARLLNIYASPKRPPSSWVGMIQLDAKRDMHREVSQLEWLPQELAEVVDRARVAGISLDDDPTVTLAALIEASIDAGQPLPRVSAERVRTALSAPNIVTLDAPAGENWPALLSTVGALDPALEAADDHRGEAAAALARLIVDDQATIVRAFLGEPAAIRSVADRLIATLRQPGEGAVATRRRCRDLFWTTGQLLSAQAATGRFPDAAAGDLAAIDAALRAAVGLDVAGAGIEGGVDNHGPGGEHHVGD
jgi:hypothetical protein